MPDQNKLSTQQPLFTPGPPAIVYKTRADYWDKVAVILNEDKTAIVRYPDPKDIALPAGLPYPGRLSEGYLLDNQGIAAGVAFTSYTLEAYAALPQAPSPQELMARIIDKDPLLVMCHCGNRSAYKNTEKALNALVAQGLKSCRSMVDKNP